MSEQLLIVDTSSIRQLIDGARTTAESSALLDLLFSNDKRVVITGDVHAELFNIEGPTGEAYRDWLSRNESLDANAIVPDKPYEIFDFSDPKVALSDALLLRSRVEPRVAQNRVETVA